MGKPFRGTIAFPGYEHVAMEVTIERMDAEELFSYRWHPYAMDPKVDFTSRRRLWSFGWRTPLRGPCSGSSNPVSTSFRPTGAMKRSA